MIVGLGSDLVRIGRIEQALGRFGDRFAVRILTPDEIGQWQARGATAAWLAKRWAAKEAAVKALGTGIRGAVGWQDIAILTGRQGEPGLALTGGAARRLRALGGDSGLVSLSDEGDYALAVVLLQRTSSPGR